MTRDRTKAVAGPVLARCPSCGSKVYAVAYSEADCEDGRIGFVNLTHYYVDDGPRTGPPHGFGCVVTSRSDHWPAALRLARRHATPKPPRRPRVRAQVCV